MERALQNLDVWCWRYLENQRNYPGLHLTARPAACEALLDCLDVLRQSGADSHRTIPLRVLDPVDEAKISGGQRYRCFGRLRLSLHSESERLRQFSFRATEDAVHFALTARHAAKFEQGLRDVRHGRGDYPIRPRKPAGMGYLAGSLDCESEALWFWPCFGHLSVQP